MADLPIHHQEGARPQLTTPASRPVTLIAAKEEPILWGVLVAAGPTLESVTLPSGIPVDELDPGIRPQDDLFRHVNGRWLARTTIAADRARESTFRILADEAENAVRAIAEEAVSAPAGSEERKFGDLYASFMDADRAEQLGSQPIDQALAAAR